MKATVTPTRKDEGEPATPTTTGEGRTRTSLVDDLASPVALMSLDEEDVNYETTEAIWDEILYDVTVQHMLLKCNGMDEHTLMKDEPTLMEHCIDTYYDVPTGRERIKQKIELVRSMENTVANGVLSTITAKLEGAEDLDTLVEVEDVVDSMFDEAFANGDDLTDEQMSMLLIKR